MHLFHSYLLSFLMLGILLIQYPPLLYAQKFTLKLGHVAIEDSPIDKGIANFSDLVKSKSKGRCTVKTFGAGVLGGSKQLIESVQLGVLELAVVPTYSLQNLFEPIKVLRLPFLFQSYHEADIFFDGEAGRSILNQLSNKGILGLAYYERGMVGIATNGKPVRAVNDYKGLKIRISSRQFEAESIKILGGNPIPLSFSEVYVALQQGLNSWLSARDRKMRQTHIHWRMNWGICLWPWSRPVLT